MTQESVVCTAAIKNAQVLLMASGIVHVFLPTDGRTFSSSQAVRNAAVSVLCAAGFEPVTVSEAFTFGYNEMPNGGVKLSYGVPCTVRVCTQKETEKRNGNQHEQ